MCTVYKGSTEQHDFYILCKSGMKIAVISGGDVAEIKGKKY
jgi:hypothetical protein